MNLNYDEEQRLIQDQAREFLVRDCDLDNLRGWENDEKALPDTVWQEMANMGWLGAMLPEVHGGMELTPTTLSRIVEEMGRALLPGTFIQSTLAAQAILLGASDPIRNEVLANLASGKTRVTLARSQEGGRFDPIGGRFYADPQDEGFLLFGEKLGVVGLAEADKIVVAAVLGLPERISEGLAFFLVDANAKGVVIKPLQTLDRTLRQASLRLDGVRVSSESLMANHAGEGNGLNDRIAALGDVYLAFDALGGAQRVMEMAVEYAKLRKAFGQPIGSYQAIKHQCADMLHRVESMRAAAIWAAWVLDGAAEGSVSGEGSEAASPAMAAAIARATAIESYDLVVASATQVMGGIACTEEHEMHLFAKRAKTLSLAFGSLSSYQETILQESGF